MVSASFCSSISRVGYSSIDSDTGTHIHNLPGIVLLFGMIGINDHEHGFFEEQGFVQGCKTPVHNRNFCLGEVFEQVGNIPVGQEVLRGFRKHGPV